MILAIDIGNSNITLGVFSADGLAFSARIHSDTSATEDEYACRILQVTSLYNLERSRINGAVMSSVVPQLIPVIKHAVKFAFGVDCLTVGPGVKTGIGIRCDNPSSVGADLICASVAAHFIYTSPALIIDMGTATKMTVVDKNGAFVGTSIAPGIETGLSALSSVTAQLPSVSLDSPGAVIGKNTVECMKSGVIYGHAAMLDGMIDRINEEAGEELSVYITGGYAEAVLPYCRRKMTYDESLVLKGLEIIYKKNCQ